MWKYVSNSLLCRFVICIYEFVSNAYNESIIYKCIKTISKWNQGSFSYKVKQNYITRPPRFTSSVAYRFLAYIGGILDGIVNGINSAYSRAYKNSFLYKAVSKLTATGEKIFGKWFRIVSFSVLAVILCSACFLLPKMAAVGIIGILVTILILRNFERAVYLVGIYPILYFVAVSTDIGSLASTWDELLIIFCVGVWFYRWLVDRRDFSFGWSPVDFPLIIFFFICIVLFLLASFDRLGLDGLRAVIEYILFFFIVIKLLRSEKGAKNLIKIMIYTGMFMSVYGIYQYIAKVETPAYWVDKVEVSSGPRVFSIVGSPNVLGCLLAMLIPLAVSLVFTERHALQKLLYTAATGLMGVCILLTGSRSSWIALSCALIIYALLSKNYKLIVGVVLAAVLAYTFVPSVQGRINYMLDPEYIVSSFRGGRFARWPKALELFYTNILFGVGFGQFGGSVATINNVKGAFYVDNYYIKAAVEMGIFGLAGFFIALYNGVVWSLRATKKVSDKVSLGIIQSGFGAMVGILITNIVLNNFDAPSVTTYFWTIAAVCIYLGYIKKGPDNVISHILSKNNS